MRKIVSSALAVALAASGVAANAAPVRTAAPVGAEEDLGAITGVSLPILAVIVAALAVGLILILDDDNKDDLPTSP